VGFCRPFLLNLTYSSSSSSSSLFSSIPLLLLLLLFPLSHLFTFYFFFFFFFFFFFLVKKTTREAECLLLSGQPPGGLVWVLRSPLSSWSFCSLPAWLWLSVLPPSAVPQAAYFPFAPVLAAAPTRYSQFTYCCKEEPISCSPWLPFGGGSGELGR